ncbi:tumor necrosis factor receptor superfamily member 5 isoform X2 [Eleginops maclovinus]|uniref:tumor necrosis factor receptor superfamily member 5 isoform X2 n=1 Tax=Eleginops maclovinus TaxID=56733 RepID=UPI003080106C
MAKNCTDDQFYGKNGACCDQCPAGQYMLSDCDGKKKTVCAKCVNGYTATKNYLPTCLECKSCSLVNHQQKVKDCTSKENAVCECVRGFYCTEDNCEHCSPVQRCPLGQGVRVEATRTNDTICAPCEDGTYSNVTDFHSACRPHTRCEDLGRELITPGTTELDAFCGNFKSYCPWILPAGLWSGLVLTALILFGLMCWRAKRKSYKAEKKETKAFFKPPFKTTGDGSSVSITLVEMTPLAPFTQLQPLPQNGHCPEISKFPLFNADNEVSWSRQHSVDSNRPTTPLKVSVSFAESTHTNGSGGYCTGILRSYSEPQEDEWCGT